MFPWFRVFLSVLAGVLASAVTAAVGGAADGGPDAPRRGPDAIVVVVADLHSAYERMPQFVAAIDRLKVAHAGVPLLICIDGDALEYGNIVARRTGGALDQALLEALVARGPTVLNLGNHEPEFFDVAESVRRFAAAGVHVISGNLRDPSNHQPYAPAATRISLGGIPLVCVGITTDRLATFRVAVRPQLDLADPVVWGKANLPGLLTPDAVPVVLSHAGLRADRALLGVVPRGTLFAGAHDHLRLIHREGGVVYFHSGSWLDGMSVARLFRTGEDVRWEVESVQFGAESAVDPAWSERVTATLRRHLTPEETATVGRTRAPLAPAEAARFCVEAARAAADVDAAFVGATTFGAGLPEGAVSRFAFDACVRFDGPLFVGEIEGERLLALLSRANQGPDTPFAERGGENLLAATRGEIQPGRRYRIATTDWIARNAKTYLGDNPPTLTEKPELTLKAAVLARLQP